MFTGIANGDFPVHELITATGSKNARGLVQTLADLHPHPVYIDVGTSLVGTGNFVSKSELKKMIK